MRLRWREILGEEERHSLVAVSRHQVGAAEHRPALGLEARFLGELPSRRRRDLFARFIESAGRDLPHLATGHVAELTNQNDAAVGIARDDADRTGVPDELPR